MLDDFAGEELYEIIEDPYFQQQAGEFEESLARWREVNAGVVFALSRDPHIGGHFPGMSGFFGISLSTDPPLTLYYRVDERRHVVTLLELDPG